MPQQGAGILEEWHIHSPRADFYNEKPESQSKKVTNTTLEVSGKAGIKTRSIAHEPKI